MHRTTVESVIARLRVRVSGRVQGVGFRPAVWRWATELQLSGFVRNTAEGVEIEIEGPQPVVAAFVQGLKERFPPQARVESIAIERLPPKGDDGLFRIEPSVGARDLRVAIPPDLAICTDCERELGDPNDRRCGYPFINCTHCGPRFTIVRRLPYDRAGTTMDAFEMCPACAAEYHDPADRRFEAQPTACPACGPSLTLLDEAGRAVAVRENALEQAAALLRGGRIVAIKGLGGYHLACDAQSESAVQRLRDRKRRPHKPFAVMFRDLSEAQQHVELSRIEQELLVNNAAPVVIARRRADSTLARAISPDTTDVGIFLPYTPLHRLLLDRMSPLVMTSANLSEEPIACREDELAELLGVVADAALTHNRPIARRCDDSVVRVADGRPVMIRRSRGWVPTTIRLPFSGPPVLACGAQQKVTFALTRDRDVLLSQHIGDLSEHPTIEFYREAVEDLIALLGARPEIVAHDLHPNYASTRFASSLGLRRIAVQHHHAHIAAVLAENGVFGPVLGVALDGVGYGPDEAIWGGEFLACTFREYQRLGHFKYYRLPGGEAAIRYPPRMALSILHAEGVALEHILARLPTLNAEQAEILCRWLESGAHSPWTSSVGRLFDAAAAVLGLCDQITYEGQAAVRLEVAAESGTPLTLPFEIRETSDKVEISMGPALVALMEFRKRGASVADLARGFHVTLAQGVCAVCERLRERTGLSQVALSGGVFQNKILLETLLQRLRAAGFTVLLPREAPPNDGGLALGQAAVAVALSAQPSEA